jgi:spermidine dehydrogenase
MKKHGRHLGMGRDITRRDFLNASLLGAGAALLNANAPGLARASQASVVATPLVGDDWYGYGGIGDYAASHGNTPDVVNTAHGLRDGRFEARDVGDTGEVYDAVIVGGGMAGLGAAWEFRESAPPGGRCLLLDNHPVFGGVSKQNEFMVGGQRLIGPQGANGFSVPDFGNEAQDFAGGDAYWYRRIGVPESFTYPEWSSDLRPLRFGGDHYGFIHWLQESVSTGRFYRTASGQQLVVDPMKNGFAGAPIGNVERENLLRWLDSGPSADQVPEDIGRWLDSMTYQHFMEDVLGLDRSVTEYINPIIASGVGGGADTVSAYGCMNVAAPGFKGISDFKIGERHSFPGGNGGFARHFLKKLIPDAIQGEDDFGDIISQPLNAQAFDREGNWLRMRMSSTVVSVEHEGSDSVSVVYVRDGQLYRVRARGVVMAGGGWINERVVRDLPQSHVDAYATFKHAPMLVANVALHNWRFMYEAGITACLYDGEFGYECNIRNPMHAGGYRPPLHPDQPTILTFYVPFPTLGLPAQAQVVKGRVELLTTSFADYELKIRRQLTELFAPWGFDAARDIAGIILNRWGHAYIVPEPGFYLGRDGQPAARDVIRQPAGRIAFGHSELRGNQHWGPAAMEGKRAMSQVLEAIG